MEEREVSIDEVDETANDFGEFVLRTHEVLGIVTEIAAGKLTVVVGRKNGRYYTLNLDAVCKLRFLKVSNAKTVRIKIAG